MSRPDPRGGNADTAAVGRAEDLVRIFCPEVAAFGRIVEVGPEALPIVPRQLLDHVGHMTVTMERFHGCEVELRVLSEAVPGSDDGAYAREILLCRPDGVVVQYGIVRIDLAAVAPEVAAEIRGRRTPLGRILLGAGLLCGVQRVELLRIDPGPHLRAALGNAERPDAGAAFGRVGEILVANRPAIELLEIVAPGTSAADRG